MIKSRLCWSIWEFIYKGYSTINRYRVNWRVFRRTAHTLSKEFKKIWTKRRRVGFFLFVLIEKYCDQYIRGQMVCWGVIMERQVRSVRVGSIVSSMYGVRTCNVEEQWKDLIGSVLYVIFCSQSVGEWKYIGRRFFPSITGGDATLVCWVSYIATVWRKCKK